MTNSEAIFIWIAVWLYGLSFILFLYGLVFKKDRAIRWGWYASVIGFLPQTVSMGIRWYVTGHPPAMREYENALLGSSLTLVIFWLLRHWYRRMEMTGIAVMPFVLFVLGNGLMARPYLEPMSPPFKSNWLWLHIFFAWAAYGAFCIGAGLGILYLLKEKAESRGWKGVDERLPDMAIMGDLMLRMVIFGFIALTVQIGAGALWARNLWGRYWGWDPVETWSLITWLIYATYIHLGVTLGWKGRRMAWLAIISLISLFITYGGIGYVATIHTPMM